MTEPEMIRLAREGDPLAFECLYQLHAGRVYRLCLRMSGNSADAEDLTQEAFLQIFRKLGSFRGESSFYTWAHRLTVNVVLMRLRKKRLPEMSLDARAEEEDSPPIINEPGLSDPQLEGTIDRVNLARAVDQLAPGFRRIFLLHDVEGLEHKEIAAMLGCTVGNSKSQLFKARNRLRQLLNEELRSQERNKRETLRKSFATQER